MTPATEVSLGRASALAALAPVAGRMADEHERVEKRAERRRGLEAELAELPALERPTSPTFTTPWWKHEFREVMLGLVVIGIPGAAMITAVVALIFEFLFGSSAIVSVVGIAFGILCGAGVVLGRTIKATVDDLDKGRRAAEAYRTYLRAVEEFDRREAERLAIRKNLEEVPG